MIVTILLQFVAQAALATELSFDCSSGDAPSPFSALGGSSCEAGGTVDICVDDEPEGGIEILCNADADGAGFGAIMYAVHYGAKSHSIWGYAGNGEPFCCVFDEEDIGDVTLVQLTGTDYDDTLRFNKDSGTFNLINHGNVNPFNAVLFGLDGDDVLDGAWTYSDRATFRQVFHGGAGDDVLHLHGLVAWEARGEEGSDTIIGSDACAGAFCLGDALYGDEPTDTNNCPDFIAGAAGADVIGGGDGDDEVCGDAGNDTLHGDDGTDDLWGGMGTDIGDGGVGVDFCSVETPISCASALGSRPSACP